MKYPAAESDKESHAFLLNASFVSAVGKGKQRFGDRTGKDNINIFQYLLLVHEDLAMPLHRSASNPINVHRSAC